MSSSEQRTAAVRLERRPPPPPPALDLDRQQRAVVEHRDGHLLVLAGPGTGKTATLAELVVARILHADDPLPPEQILALTFGRRAARDLSQRIGSRLAGGPVPVVSTFHSFAYGALRVHSDPTSFLNPPRLLVAAEQEARLRELLTHSIEEGRVAWPTSLSGAVGTRGIAEQVRALLARARGQGLDGRDLARIGRQEGVPVWSALGGFFEEYLATLEFEGSIDYSELILRAAVLANDPKAGRVLRSAYRLVVVDEYQDTDPAQVALLRGLAAGGAQVVAVGDPDQAIYGFRGADVRGILHFPEVFADAAGTPARVEVLRTARRFPAAIAQAASGVLGAVSLAPLPAAVQRQHRTPLSRPGAARVEVRTYPSAGSEAAGIAETLLRAHAGDSGQPGLAWSQMAVLVRNPAVQGPALTRAMRSAGIPVSLPADESPLVDEPAVVTLLAVVSLAIAPEEAAPRVSRTLLAGPLGRADAMAIRGLGRALLARHRHEQGLGPGHPGGGDRDADGGVPGAGAGAGGVGVDVEGDGDGGGGRDGQADADVEADVESGREPAAPVTSDALLAEAVVSGAIPAGDLAAASASAVAGLARVAACVRAAREAIDAGQLVSEVLWAVWTASDWPERLRAAALRPRAVAAAAAAHRDLDAVVALFEMANRLPLQRAGRVGVAAFLDDLAALRLPQELRAVAEPDRDQVRLLSAHRAKGLEWELVVVGSVQEGQWPDVLLRSDLLRVAELGPGGRIAGQTHADLLAEERRLMYVACTRARRHLVVTAVAERIEGGLQASRFLPEIGDVQAMPARSAAPMSAEGIVASLREAAQAPVLPEGDPDRAQVEELRAAAVQRLVVLGRLGRAGGPLGPLAAADPSRWWGALPLTPEAFQPVAPASRLGDAPPAAGSAAESATAEASAASAPATLRLSPSAIESLIECPLRWFLDKRVGASAPPGSAATIGMIVHAIADALARGDVTDPAEVGSVVDEVWSSMPFAAQYERVRERARVEDMINALVRWEQRSERAAVASEQRFSMVFPGGGSIVEVSGAIDRVDKAPDGALHVVDFKTGKAAASRAATAQNAQLGLYQLAIRDGALEEPADAGAHARLGGAELVFLSDQLKGGMPKVRTQAPIDGGHTWVDDVIGEAAELAAGPQYPARVNSRCARCAYRYVCPAQAPTPAPVAPQPSADEPASAPVGSRGGGSRPSRAAPDRSALAGESDPAPQVPVQEPLWGGALE